MIARTWHGTVPLERADAYEAYLDKTGIADYRSTPGNQGVLLLRRDEGAITHFTIVTLWESVEAIRAFAGDDISVARYYDEDKEFLLEFEPAVKHDRVVYAAYPAPT